MIASLALLFLFAAPRKSYPMTNTVTITAIASVDLTLELKESVTIIIKPRGKR